MSPKLFRSTRIIRGIRRTLLAVAYPAWTYSAVFIVGGLLASLVIYLSANQIGITIDETVPLHLMIISLFSYSVGLAILLFEPYAVRSMTWAAINNLLGLARRPVVRDAGVALLGWAAYILISTAVTALIATFMPTVNLDQEQAIGFATNGSPMDKLYAFVVIVIAAPIVEETVFRGYLYGNLRRFMPWWLGGLMTSVLFGYVHGQWNVGIDVFIMSMVACYMRERTGAIWSGIYLHAIKNSIAYYLLFFAPPWLLQLLFGPWP